MGKEEERKNDGAGRVKKEQQQEASGPWGGWGVPPTCLLDRNPKHKTETQHCNKFNKDFKNGPPLEVGQRRRNIV